MKATLLRHGPTSGNLLSRYVGGTDLPLCPEGIALAKSLIPDSAVKKVYVSSLCRTSQTARIVYPEAEVIPVAGLDEMNFGTFEGKSHADLEHDPAYIAWLSSQCEDACPGGESKAFFTERCRKGFLKIIHEEYAASADEVHLVVHGGTIMAIMASLAQQEQPYFSWKAECCGGFRVDIDHLNEIRPLRVFETLSPTSGKRRL